MLAELSDVKLTCLCKSARVPFVGCIIDVLSHRREREGEKGELQTLTVKIAQLLNHKKNTNHKNIIYG